MTSKKFRLFSHIFTPIKSLQRFVVTHQNVPIRLRKGDIIPAGSFSEEPATHMRTGKTSCDLMVIDIQDDILICEPV